MFLEIQVAKVTLNLREGYGRVGRVEVEYPDGTFSVYSSLTTALETSRNQGYGTDFTERFSFYIPKNYDTNMDKIAKEMGFKDAAELHKLVASVPTWDSRAVKWQLEDGTKEGLLKLLEEKRRAT